MWLLCHFTLFLFCLRLSCIWVHLNHVNVLCYSPVHSPWIKTWNEAQYVCHMVFPVCFFLEISFVFTPTLSSSLQVILNSWVTCWVVWGWRGRGNHYIEITFWSHKYFFEGLQSASRHFVQGSLIIESGWIREMPEYSFHAIEQNLRYDINRGTLRWAMIHGICFVGRFSTVLMLGLGLAFIIIHLMR